MSASTEVCNMIIDRSKLVFVRILDAALPHFVEAKAVEFLGVREERGIVGESMSGSIDKGARFEVCAIGEIYRLEDFTAEGRCFCVSS